MVEGGSEPPTFANIKAMGLLAAPTELDRSGSIVWVAGDDRAISWRRIEAGDRGRASFFDTWGPGAVPDGSVWPLRDRRRTRRIVEGLAIGAPSGGFR